MNIFQIILGIYILALSAFPARQAEAGGTNQKQDGQLLLDRSKSLAVGKIREVQGHSGQSFALIDLVEDAPLAQELVIDVVRSAKASADMDIPIGRIRLIEVKGRQAFGEIIEDGTLVSRAFFRRYPGIMRGDQVRFEALQIARSFDVSPLIALRFDELFLDPQASASEFSLSDLGKERLARALARFESMRQAGITIEAYTSNRGDESVNRMESHHRAMVVKQHLIETFGFDASKILVLAMGEGESSLENFNAYDQAQARSIVLRAKAF